MVTFDVAFDLSYNNGNSAFFIHSYLNADYPGYFPCGGGNVQAPKAANGLGTARDQVGKSFLDIELTNPARGAVGVPVNMPIATTYQYDATVELTSPTNSPGMTATKVFLSGTTDRVTILNATVIINALITDVIAVKTDVWAQNGNARCWVAGSSQFFNDPSITGLLFCTNPRQYAVNINTADPVSKNITYKVYLDMNDNGSLDGGDILAYTSGTISISSSNPYSSGQLSLDPQYSATKPFSEKGYLILVEGPTLSNSVIKLIPFPACIPLPVEFKSFTATRNRNNVLLRWETASEQNNSGFAVERNTGGNWEQIGWVPTQAAGGNSDAVLVYTYNDINNIKGITQYRIRQVDIDDKSTYSMVRSVRGEGQLGKTIVYPNPSNDGKVNVVFSDISVTRDISVMDMSGRVVRQMKGIVNNNVTIDNLQPGMYTLRITAIETGEQAVEKVVVNKR